MDKNIIFFDIDGTLISEDTHKIPHSTIDAIKNARRNGHKLFINTGRTLVILPPILRELEFDGYICGCGTYIEYNNEVLLHKPLPTDLFKELIEDMRKYGLDGIIEGREKLYFDTKISPHNEEVTKILEGQVMDEINTYFTWDDEDINADKFVIFLDERSNFTPFHEKYKDKFEFIKRADNFYEIIPQNYSKATGIEFIMKYLDVPHKNTFAVGDSTNDLSMLKYVENSIAMGNSSKELFPLVSYVTTDLEDNGIYNALAHYNMI